MAQVAGNTQWLKVDTSATAAAAAQQQHQQHSGNRGKNFLFLF